MAASTKIIAALHANWWLNVAGLFLSFVGSVVLVRTVPPELYAQYGAVLAIIGIATLLFEAGANSGLTRYFREASDRQARGTFYLKMQRRRALAAAACAVALVLLGPVYARTTELGSAAAERWLFVVIALIVAATLTKLLAHYGLLALFETRTALFLQQGFLVLRSASLAIVVIAGGGLAAISGTLLALALLEALVVHSRLWRLVHAERASLPSRFVNRAQRFGLFTIFDKACAMLGSGSVILLVLAPNHSVAVIAGLALAVDLVGKAVSLTAMPMGNLVAPYLSHASDDRADQGRAIARVLKLSSLLYAFAVGAALLLFPSFVHVVYGGKYDFAIALTLLLLVPTAFENWIRGCCSPALLRNERFGSLFKLNLVQAVATVTTIALVRHQSVEVVVASVGGVRAAIASINLLLLRSLLPARSYRVPMQGALVGVLACALAYGWGSLLPLPALPRDLIEGAVFALLFYAGLRWVVLRDSDTLHLAHRITGSRGRVFLPPAPLVQT